MAKKKFMIVLIQRDDIPGGQAIQIRPNDDQEQYPGRYPPGTRFFEASAELEIGEIADLSLLDWYGPLFSGPDLLGRILGGANRLEEVTISSSERRD